MNRLLLAKVLAIRHKNWQEADWMFGAVADGGSWRGMETNGKGIGENGRKGGKEKEEASGCM